MAAAVFTLMNFNLVLTPWYCTDYGRSIFLNKLNYIYRSRSAAP
jgi:hypothetical protein